MSDPLAAAPGTAPGAPRTGSLAGRTVLVARDPARAAGLAALLRERGAEVVVAPVTATAPAPDAAALEAAVRGLAAGEHAWVVVTSVNAVAPLRQAADRAGVVLAEAPVRWAAVGHATRRALEAAGVTVGLVPAERTAEGLVAAFPPAPEPARGVARAVPGVGPGAGPGSGRSLLLPLGDLARPVLADGLAARGWSPRTVVAYRTVPATLPTDVVRRAHDGDLAAVVVTAGSVAREVARQLAGAFGRPGAPALVTIGRPSADAAREAGLPVAAVAAAPTDSALADAVGSALSGRARAVPHAGSGTTTKEDHE
ncbi:hypothetical protein DNL40_07440 [Xylanimonas oleitrophica]|uniref:Uroporphyrinogen-III synthase n=1 Tax=Xylanimonas oleitrophica TaxID=2607479 RepID=A0A2W5WPL8_9MICO|nr:uroporphyrinogen-III synthase [Xylanimonas oleitrophica]PZR53347.1 hypothetical protein DNL40_07440 [Xylanimonas oleitrophica]